MSHNRKAPEPTLMSRVEGVLAAADDFLTVSQLVAASGIDQHHVQSCIWWLKKVRAVESVESDGQLWWFSTPETDLRTRRVEMRRPEDKPRRQRRMNLKKEVTA